MVTDKGEALAKLKEGKDVLMSEERTIYLIDASGSMAETIGYDGDKVMSKSTAVRKAMGAMMEARLAYPTQDHVGIVTFGQGDYAATGRAFTKVLCDLGPASSHHIQAAQGINAMGDTPMYQGFEKAATLLAKADGMVRIVLMSDGEPNSGYSKSDVIAQVKKLSKQYGFIIDTVGIGVPGKTHEYDEQFMKTLAHEGAGEFFPIDTVDDLVKLLKRTAMERKALLGGGIRLLGDGAAVYGKPSKKESANV